MIKSQRKGTNVQEEKKNTLKALFEKHREVILYLIFGVLTTFVGWFVYFIILIPGKALLGIPAEDTASGRYLVLYTAAQIIQWIAAVLFAFVTNRKFVFDGEGTDPVWKQLTVFAGGRLLSFGADYLVTFFGALGLSLLFPALNALVLFGRPWNLNEILAKFVAAVIVIVSNYFFSKFLVFRKKDRE